MKNKKKVYSFVIYHEVCDRLNVAATSKAKALAKLKTELSNGNVELDLNESDDTVIPMRSDDRIELESVDTNPTSLIDDCHPDVDIDASK